MDNIDIEVTQKDIDAISEMVEMSPAGWDTVHPAAIIRSCVLYYRRKEQEERLRAREGRGGAITDDYVLTFGNHRGQRIGDVPASYLCWLWNNGIAGETGGGPGSLIRRYIIDNIAALSKEHPDGDWRGAADER